MNWFWWWYFCDCDSYDDEPKRPRYFKKTPPRKLTKEEESQLVKTAILLAISILVIATLALVSYNDTIYNLSQISKAIH